MFSKNIYTKIMESPKFDILDVTILDLFKKFNSTKEGLNERQSNINAIKYGKNILSREKNNIGSIFASQFKNALILLLIIALILSILLGQYSDAIVIGVIVLLNAFISFFQEYRSEVAVERLSKLIEMDVLVKRSNDKVSVPQSYIVLGDIVILQEGGIVPADICLISADDFEVNESQLTGESDSIVKTPVLEGKNITKDSLVFAGSTIDKGEAIGIVYATANATSLGKIAKLSSETVKVTQYQKNLQNFSTFLIIVTLVTLLIVFISKVLITGSFSNISALFIFIIALAISVVPEALPVIATVTMSYGAIRLSKRHVIVKRLSSLEDFGNINVLCTDKTGTLTENKMKVESLVSDDNTLFCEFAYAEIESGTHKRRKFLSSYDLAFSEYVSEDTKRKSKSLSIAKELPFDPDSRRRRIVFEDTSSHKHYLVVFGDLETLLKISVCEKKENYLKKSLEEGKMGLRHFAISYREVFNYTDDFDIIKNEEHLVFLGYASLSDPLRKDALSTIKFAERLGVDIKILTGDSLEVSEYVAREVGLISEGDIVYSGEDIAKMTPHDLKVAVRTGKVFAKVSPEQKYLIIQTLKEDHIVGYQGDGINDAPSLKLADVAIAVEGATDVAKDSADIILLQKNLNTVISGIEYGRSIFVNINKYIKYTMVGNWGNLFALSFLYLFNASLPILAVQLLLSSLITDIPLITIATDNVDSHEVSSPERYDVHSLMFISIVLGMLTTIFELVFFSTLKNYSPAFSQTSIYIVITLLQLIVIFSIRSKSHFWKAKDPSYQLMIAMLGGSIISVLMAYFPFTMRIFHFIFLPLSELSFIILMVLVYLFILDIVKVWYYKVFEKSVSILPTR